MSATIRCPCCGSDTGVSQPTTGTPDWSPDQRGLLARMKLAGMSDKVLTRVFKVSISTMRRLMIDDGAPGRRWALSSMRVRA